MKQPSHESRRSFLKGSAVLTGTAMGAGAMPASAVALAGSMGKSNKAPYRAPLFDPTLENYPGYSAHIEVPHTLQQKD
jgi:hypothetical protein